MKKILMITAFLLVPAIAYLQPEIFSIKKDVIGYLRALEDRNLERIMTYATLKEFSYSQKLNLALTIDRIFRDTSFMVSYSEGDFVDATETVKYQGMEYRTVFFTIHLNISPGEVEDSQTICDILENQYGVKNIFYDEHAGSVDIQVFDWMYALKTPSDSTWTFLTGNSNYLVENLIPQIVIDTFAIDVVSWMARRI